MRNQCRWNSIGLICALGVFLHHPVPLNSVLIPSDPPPLLSLSAVDDFHHGTGQAEKNGWALNFRRDRPGYALQSAKSPWLLEPGLHRARFVIRRGVYPKKGFLHKTYDLFRLEVWDLTRNELIARRDIQIGEFVRVNKDHEFWIEFATDGRAGHALEPRVHWMGLANGELVRVDLQRFPDVSLTELEKKAARLGREMENRYIENGFVVARLPNDEADETGDATTYTGWYAASLAWAYQVTRDPTDLQNLENSLQALHLTIKGTYERPLVTRYVDPDGHPFAKSASKDSYTGLFFAYATAAPFITNQSLKLQMASDLERIANRFLKEGLILKEGQTEIVSLAPYFAETTVRKGIHNLITRKDTHRKFIKGLSRANARLPYGNLWPGYKNLMRSVRKKDPDEIFKNVVPTLNGIFQTAARARNILREQYRSDLFLRRISHRDYPGKKLEAELTEILSLFPVLENQNRIRRLSDLKILSSNAIIALHIVRSALELSGQDQFEEYYRANLYTQDELLKTALLWEGKDDQLIELIAGKPEADRTRKGVLTPLSLHNLFRMEKNQAVKESYFSLLQRRFDAARHDDNPLLMALYDAATGKPDHVRFVLRALDLYPEERQGLGWEYWRDSGKDVARTWGSGERGLYALEPLPVSHRARDSFLWQRNPRQLFGDMVERRYPPTDFLFLYWFSRAHQLIPDPPVNENTWGVFTPSDSAGFRHSPE